MMLKLSVSLHRIALLKDFFVQPIYGGVNVHMYLGLKSKKCFSTLVNV
jgi:hypothetical protein